MADGTAWCSYDEAAELLGVPAEAVKRMALRRGWARSHGPAGGTLVAVPEEIPSEAEPDDIDLGRAGARTLLAHLEAHVDRLTEELAEAWTEMRGVRYEAESLRVEAGRVQVFAALVEAERAVGQDPGGAGSARGRAGRVAGTGSRAWCRCSWTTGQGGGGRSERLAASRSGGTSPVRYGYISSELMDPTVVDPCTT